MNEPQTASELMMQNQLQKKESDSNCILPNVQMQQFLLEVIEQTNFPGKMCEFVSQVKNSLKTAKIG